MRRCIKQNSRGYQHRYRSAKGHEADQYLQLKQKKIFVSSLSEVDPTFPIMQLNTIIH